MPMSGALGKNAIQANAVPRNEKSEPAPHRLSRLKSGLAVMAVAGGIAFSTAAPSAAALDGMTNNHSNWWTAHAEIWIFNKSMGYQSQARLGDHWNFGRRSNEYSRAHVDGFNWTHNAFQIRVW